MKLQAPVWFDNVVRSILLCSALSFLVWVFALYSKLHEVPVGFADGVKFKTYFQAHNWWPYPFFFIVLLPVVHLTWGSFLLAWRDLGRSGVLVTADGAAASERELDSLVAAIVRRRWWVILAAATAAFAINAYDAPQSILVLLGGDTILLAEQTQIACIAPNAWMKWYFDAVNSMSVAPSNEICAHSLVTEKKGLTAPASAWIFTLVTLAQQFMLVFFVSVIIAQLLFHTLFFGALEWLLPDNKLHIRLNPNSTVFEFGLERWNFALNNFYWFSCPIMLLVFLSRTATNESDFAPGQQLLSLLVPAVLLAPMIITILVRQLRLPKVWGEIANEPGNLYSKQQLWPLDRNWSSKLGIILAFTLAAFSLGYEVQALVGLTG